MPDSSSSGQCALPVDGGKADVMVRGIVGQTGWWDGLIRLISGQIPTVYCTTAVHVPIRSHWPFADMTGRMVDG